MRTPGLLLPLHERRFRRLWVGQALSSIGDGIFPIALTTALLGSRGEVTFGLALGVESIALGVTALFGGVLADRIRRSHSMIIADVTRLLGAVGFALGAATHSWLLYALAAAMGIGAALFRPAYGAVVPTLVEAAHLQAANALQSMTNRLALILGPALGGLLVSWASTQAAFWFNAATFGFSILTLIGLRDSKPERTVMASFLVEVREGWAAVLARRWILIVIVQGTVQLMLVMAPSLVLLPIALNGRGELDALGQILAAQAVGALLGGLFAARVRTRQPGTVALVALSFLGLQLLALALDWPLWALTAGAVATGFGYAVFGVLWFSSLQRHVPRNVLGRVLSIEVLGTYALEPVGLALAPMLVHAAGLMPVLLGGLAVLVVTTILPLASAQVRTFGADTEVDSADKNET